jgi:transposase-like protein
MATKQTGTPIRDTVPNTLVQAIRYFSDEDRCIAYLAARRWPDGQVKCPTCGSGAVLWLKNQRRWKCGNDHPRRQFSVKVGTIFEDSPLSLSKWLPAVWLIANCKNGVSSLELHRALEVTQKTAWFMLHRIRLAMQRTGTLMGDGGPVEADETFIGGKARNMHKHKRAERIPKRGASTGKEIVFGLLDRRSGKVRAKHIANRQRETLHAEVRKHVAPGAELFTDEWQPYAGMEEFVHEFVNHAEQYVRGNVHTNGLENFWSLLKRGLRGTYVSVEPFHLFRYLDEQAFRYNERKHEEGDGGRFDELLSTVANRRLTYKELTGKDESAPTAATV